MKLRNTDALTGVERKAGPQGAFSKMAGKLAVAAIIGGAVLALSGTGCKPKDSPPPSPSATVTQSAETPTPALPAMTRSATPATPASSAVSAAPSSATSSVAPAPAVSSTASAPTGSASAGVAPAAPAAGRPDQCRAIPSIERWASKRGLDPMLVRAFALTQSNLNNCAATKMCRAGFEEGNCFGPGPGKDEGYDVALDEMYDPAGTCQFANSSGTPAPDWRWLALGVMQTLEPPYTFWPAAYHPDGVDGQYFDVFERSGLVSGLDLSEARACNPRFNPFNAEDSLCLGTSKLERMYRAALAWVRVHRVQLGIAENDARGNERMAVYVLGNMYSGVWGSRLRSADHPRCSSSINNGDCWAYGFSQSAAVNDDYCNSGAGGGDTQRCSSGHPARNPPFVCNGDTDFIQYVRDCELPFLPRAVDNGAAVLRVYTDLKSRCGRK
jgi:hypothetical protein